MTKGVFKMGTSYLISSIFNYGISLLTVPIFTRILSMTDYGIVTTYMSWVSIISMVIGCAMHMGIRLAFVDYVQKIDDIMSTVLTFTLVLFLSVLFVVIGGIFLLRINVNVALVYMCLVQSFSTAVITDYSMYLMMQYKYKFRTVLMVLPPLLSVLTALVVILCFLKSNLYMGRIVPNMLVYALFCIVLLVLAYRRSGPRIKKADLSYTLKISSPLIIHGVSLSVLSQADRTMITALADASQTGLYSLVYNFSMIGAVITTALDGIWVPWFLQKMVKKDWAAINTIAMDYVHFITYLIVGLTMVSPEILKLLAPQPYWKGVAIIPPIILSNYIIFLYTLYVNIEHFHKKTVYISINTLIAAAANVLLNFLLIPRFGYTAAAYTTLAAYVLSFVLHASYAKKLQPSLYPIKSFAEPMTYIAVSLVLFYVLGNLMWARWAIAFAFAGAMFFRQRKRIGILMPDLSNRYAFFRC